MGTGANCIYPIIGSQSYGWQFVGSDIDPVAVKTAGVMIQSNANLKPHIELRQQKDISAIFRGIISQTDRFDITLCNPPFHGSLAEAIVGNQRKTENLGNNKKEARHTPVKDGANFGGQNGELYCEGGETSFLKRVAGESKQFGQQVCWFSSLVSKGDNVRLLKRQLKKLGAVDTQVLEMKQGNKVSRVIAWSYLDQAARKAWADKHWVE
uniref:Ribosomal RNA large subunit methyltransferase F (EC) n=1 Tax=uncultured Thiotrichaceae bacterium TaxID=298394 RepID=A0A6S6UA16_9GAMM|nr:MAG: Ribosomal RNA large subunit methyltransferase F (EC [uncultured Thiotrichaceae bacterium]